MPASAATTKHLAEVPTAAGRREDAAEMLDSAIALYAEKGHVVGAAHARSLLTGLDA